QKFGIARQPGLVPAAEICIKLTPEFTADSVRGLEDFDYVWISFIFHGVLDEGWAQMVRPPRLGGKQKMGVFATRSPHRPNHLGLSLLKLERIETGKPEELNVVWAESTLAEHLSTEEKHLIEQSIAQDPRPAYQDIPERVYVMNIADYEVQFRIENKCATVIKLSTI
ncbi:MAG: tRNA (N6-threonylcarbamoyladenosine(37)-N6)-methyltransferase TrmO, partial [Neisseria sp.]|nr:tRNA (N6-threonylcarbamoyladenosine(37)-N6)-methyltransferase TrmO [Neisseria sp.]